MSKIFIRIVICLAALVLLILPALSLADTLIKTKSHSDAFEIMGEKTPESNMVVTTWMSDNKIRTNYGDTASSLMIVEKDMLYILDHINKSYVEMNIKGLNKMMGEAMSEAEAAGLENPMGIKVEVTKSEETMEILGYKCTKYITKLTLPMGVTTTDTWATEDIELNAQLYDIATKPMMAGMPGFEAIFNEFKKIKGFPVKSTTKMSVMGKDMNSSEELIEVSEKDAPAGTYEIPKGYSKVEQSSPMGF